MSVERWAMGALMVAGLFQTLGVSAETYSVADDYGWTFPPNALASFFDDWAKEHVFFVGDYLFFQYQQGYHDVLQVSAADLADCSVANPIVTYSYANATVALNTTGYFGFICGVPGHCAANMKLEVNVLAIGTPVPSPVPVAPSSSPTGGPTGANGPTSSGPSAAPISSDASRRPHLRAMIVGAVLAIGALLFVQTNWAAFAI